MQDLNVALFLLKSLFFSGCPMCKSGLCPPRKVEILARRNKTVAGWRRNDDRYSLAVSKSIRVDLSTPIGEGENRYRALKKADFVRSIFVVGVKRLELPCFRTSS